MKTRALVAGAKWWIVALLAQVVVPQLWAAPTVLQGTTSPQPLVVGRSYTVWVATTPDVTDGYVFVDFRPTIAARPRLALSYDAAEGKWRASSTAPAAPGLTQPVAVTLSAYVFDSTRKMGLYSWKATLVSTPPNTKPVANAGPDQSSPVGASVTLDGSGSTDLDGNPLTYAWSWVSRPPGSGAALSSPTAVKPTFTVDEPGDYTLRLVVNDGTEDSLPDDVTVSTVNSPPVAEAGADGLTFVGNLVTLDGSGSSDADGDSLTYAWAFVSRPAGSVASLSDPTAMKPSFVPDKFGAYVARLIVNDGTIDSAPDTVTVTTDNSPPVAEAGPNQTVRTADTVTLDGSGSTDVDGNPLTYTWSLIAKPAGSTAALSDPHLVNPTFVADKFGTYVAQLVVHDGTADSAPDTVTVSTDNSAPVANAGPDQTAHVGDSVTLNGGGSYDIDGNLLDFTWSLLSRPPGSAAVLSDPHAVGPTFVLDRPGAYVAQLIVNDGIVNSPPDTVAITSENSAPVANAGPDQSMFVGTSITLDGSASSDVDGDPLSYFWSFTSIPAGSAATLSDPNAIKPTFNLDRWGTYVAQLIVDDGQVESAPDTVVISTLNSPPVANAGPDQTAYVGTAVTLDGGASYDVDGNLLTYSWSLTTRPAGSTATLSSPTSVNPTFAVDRPGVYVAQLVVHDGTVNSAPDTVTITTQNSAPVANAGPDQSVTVGATVVLDGSGSQDVDGDPLAYTWSLTGRPAGSAASLSTPTLPNPTFGVDLPGTYVAQLIVNDGTVDSAPDTVTISTVNSPPVADAGSDATVETGATVSLDGSGSHDVDGDTLYYAWSFTSLPAGSAAAIQDANLVHASFVPDVAGTYVVQLQVSDGSMGGVDTVTFTVNQAKVAVPDVVGMTAGAANTALGALGLTVATSYEHHAEPAGQVFSQSPAAGTLVSPGETVHLWVSLGPLPTQLSIDPAASSMPTRSTRALTVRLDAPAPAGGVTVALGYSNSRVTGPPSVAIAEGAQQTAFEVASAVTSGSVVINATADGLASASAQINVSLRGFSLSVPLLGINRTVTGKITLDLPAPVGGVAIDLSLSAAGIVTLDPATVNIAEGETVGTFQASSEDLVGGVTLTANGAGAGCATKTLLIQVTDRMINVPAAVALALGETRTIQVQIAPTAAPAGGVAIALESSDPTVVEVLTPTVMVPEGFFAATATLRAATGKTGTATLTATSDAFATDHCAATVSAELQILESFLDFLTTETELIHVRLNSGGQPYPAPPGGLTVTLESGTPGAVQVPASIVIPEGESIGTATVIYGGLEAIPCQATITATAPVFGSDSLVATVAVEPTAGSLAFSTSYNRRLGGSMMANWTFNLPSATHPPVRVQLKSRDHTKALISADQTTAGNPVLEVDVPNGTSSVSFTLQSADIAALGGVEITASANAYGDATLPLTVVQPVLEISGLGASQNVFGADDSFYAYQGITYDNSGTSLYWTQNRSLSAASPLTVTFTSGDVAVGTVKNTAASGDSVTASIQPGEYYTPTSVASGGVAFDPLTPGSTSVRATAAGFADPFAPATVAVTVNAAAITLNNGGYNSRLGGGLQHGSASITLSGGEHGGVTIRVASGAAAILRVAPDQATVGAETIDLVFASGQTSKSFCLQGVSPAALGDVTLTANEVSATPRFAPASAVVHVVQPVIEINGLSASQNVLGADDPFYADCGITYSDGATYLYWNQYWSRSAGGPLTVTFTSGDTAVGNVKNSGGGGATVTALIQPGDYYTPTSVAAGGVAFDPIGPGSATVKAAAPGFRDPFAPASVAVTVNPASITLSSSYNNRLGGGLQHGSASITLSGGEHGGVTIRVASGDIGKLKVAPDTATAGTEAIDLVFANGASSKSFSLQGISPTALGDVTLTATDVTPTPKFSPANSVVHVVQPVLEINGLTASQNVLGADDPFYAYCGITYSDGGTYLYWNQYWSRSAGGPLIVTFASGDTAVGTVKTSGGGGASVTAAIQPGEYYTPTTVAAGGVAFDPVGPGSATVKATATGFRDPFAPASVAVTVNPATTTLAANYNNRLGGGLQHGSASVTLSGGEHGGVTIRVASGAPALLKVAPDEDTVGTDTIDLFFPNGTTSKSFSLQGVSPTALGDVTLSATDVTATPKFTPANTVVHVVQPVLELAGLSTSQNALAAEDPFYAYCGITYDDTGTSLYWNQDWSRSAGGPLTVTFTTSDATVGELVNLLTPAGAASLTAQIGPAEYYTPTTVTSGGVAFDPTAPGTATVTATAPGFKTPFADASRTVTVTPGTLTVSAVSGVNRIGGGLQDDCRVTVSGSAHGGLSVRVASLATTKALVAPDATSPGAAFIDVFIPGGQTYKDFYVQGLSGAAGAVSIVASSTLTSDGSLSLGIEKPVVEILSLAQSNYGTEDPFQVRTGIPSAGSTSMQVEQTVSAGAPTPLAVDLTLSNGTVGQLTTYAGAGPVARVYVVQNSSRSPAAKADGGVAFQGLRTGSTTVTASGPDVLSTLPASSIQIGVGVLYLPAGQQNLSRLAGASASASSSYSSSYPPSNGIDGNPSTSWFTANNDASPWLTVSLPSEATVYSLQILDSASYPTGYDFLTGKFRVYDGSDALLYESGTVTFSQGNVEYTLPAAVPSARKVTFTALTWESVEPGLGEFAVVGTQP